MLTALLTVNVSVNVNNIADGQLHDAILNKNMYCIPRHGVPIYILRIGYFTQYGILCRAKCTVLVPSSRK